MNILIIDRWLKKSLNFLFVSLFILIPFFFTSVNSELFELNKIILLYSFTILITTLWLTRMILNRQIIFQKTPLDIFLGLFFLSQLLSTIFSIDRHTSLYGYYSRFNGGLFSIISYLLLYWAFVANADENLVKKILKASLWSASIVAIYGILEHFGHSFSCLMFFGKFDTSCWVQRVQERVFATLGQPNWLASYLALLIPTIFALQLNSEFQSKNPQKSLIKNFKYSFLFVIFSSCLLFTLSRSGFLAFLFSYLVFWITSFFCYSAKIKTFFKPFLSFALLSLILIFVFGSPFSQINRFFSYKTFFSQKNQSASPPPPSSAPSSFEDGGISESGDIRKIVWKGAWEIFKHYPLFGSGVETFAYSYYNFRPMEHNLVSEWDFLYNKAHNEYLNYLATTGAFGLGTYLLLILFFLYWCFKKILAARQSPLPNNFFWLLGLLSGYLTILITNFFGFSVVIVSLYFFTIPAFVFVLTTPKTTVKVSSSTSSPNFFLLLPFLPGIYLLWSVINLWRADYFYAQGSKFTKLNDFQNAYLSLYKAKNIFPTEPVFLSDLSFITTNLAYLATSQNQQTAGEELISLAINYSDQAYKISPRNLNVLKTRIKVFYALSLIKPEYLNKAIETLNEAIKLAPTDPKLVYNLGLLYNRLGDSNLAIQTIEKSLEMKPNYVDAKNTLSLLYEQAGNKKKALQLLEELIKLAPENAEDFQKRIQNLKNEK